MSELLQLVASVGIGGLVAYCVWHTLLFIKPFLSFLFPHYYPVLYDVSSIEPQPPPPRSVIEETCRKEFTKFKVNGTKWDVIIVGSGISALTSGVLLSRAGKKVLVLEQAPEAGGCLRTFHLDGYEFQVGCHVLGLTGPCEGVNSFDLLNQATGGAMAFEKQDPEFEQILIRHKDESKTKLYTQRFGSQAVWEESMIAQFPKEADTIRKFTQACSEAYKSTYIVFVVKYLPFWLVRLVLKIGFIRKLFEYEKWQNLNTRDYLNSLSDNSDLKKFMACPAGYIVPDPEGSNMIVTGFIPKFLINGVFYPLGGPAKMAYHLVKQIQRMGGEVLVNANVAAILLDKDKTRAYAVAVESENEGSLVIEAPIIISSAGIWNTFERLIPREVSMQFPIIAEALRVAPPLAPCAPLIAWVGLKGTTEELGIKQASVWHLRGEGDFFQEYKSYLEMTREQVLEMEEVPFEWTLIQFMSARESDYNVRNPGKSVCMIAGFIKWDWFAEWDNMNLNERGEKYEKLKQTLGARLIHNWLLQFPHLKDKIDLINFSSPVSFTNWLRRYHGKLMGFDMNASRFTLEVLSAMRPSTGIEGLYMTGQEVTTGGVTNSCAAGFMTVGEILGRNLLLELLAMNWNKPNRDFHIL
ncbi:unnamed protein product [Notodromas monacha]|uniref:All-trans-retinol 13,14-reductase n=1 Tax=Notodromas monacha TaxID=399045 RepID=A0A7R9BXZ5_9CRUS|nr:unnamed protein product [Notodromas monacha]CAG0923865.1 unnamed protein product [Notodromas monacha]